MNPNAVRKPEQIRLIMECRQSGLSDYQWCQQQGIKPGTFYNWVSILRKASYTIPDSESKLSELPVRQELQCIGGMQLCRNTLKHLKNLK